MHTHIPLHYTFLKTLKFFHDAATLPHASIHTHHALKSSLAVRLWQDVVSFLCGFKVLPVADLRSEVARHCDFLFPTYVQVRYRIIKHLINFIQLPSRISMFDDTVPTPEIRFQQYRVPNDV